MPGTWVNKRAQLEECVRYLSQHGRHADSPDSYDVLSYFLHLQTKFLSPNTVKNYLSGARTWVLSLSGSAEAFDCYHLSILKRGLDAALNHTPSQAPPVSPRDLMQIVDALIKCGP